MASPGLSPTRRRRHLTAVEVKDYLEKHDLHRKVEEMMAQVFELQPEEPVPYMIAYLRKHGPSEEVQREESTWQQKYQELARAAAEREAALAARTADLERELRAAAETGLRAENSTLAAENHRLEQENVILKLTAENQQLFADNQRLMAYSTQGSAVDLEAAEPYMFGRFPDASEGFDGEVYAVKPSEAPLDLVDADKLSASTTAASWAPTTAPAHSVLFDEEDEDHHGQAMAHAASSEAQRLAKMFTLEAIGAEGDDA